MFSDTEPVAVTEAAPRKVILVAEDDEANAEVLLQVLVQETSSQVYVAADGPAALQLMSQITPDLFILDYRLPTMTGMELYECLHCSPAVQTDACSHPDCLSGGLSRSHRKPQAVGLSQTLPCGRVALAHCKGVRPLIVLSSQELVLQAVS